MSENEPSIPLTYARSQFDRVIDWYKSADLKAQIILTINGAFLTFITSSVFKGPQEIWQITHKLYAFTWLCLFLMCVCLIGSIAVALSCLWSRIFLTEERDQVLLEAKAKLKESSRYPASVMLFFKTITWLDHDRFVTEMKDVDEKFEIEALSSQVYLLSQRVNIKHILVNIGFLLTGASLVFFLIGGVSYVVNLL